MSYRTLLVLVTGLILAVASASGLAAGETKGKLYRWVDANGRVYYSDRVPPEASGIERQEKSAQGQTLRQVERAKTAEERAAEEERLKAEEAERQAKAKRVEEDRILLLTFSSADEIVRARDDRLSAVDVRIKLTEDRLAKLDPQLEQARKEAVQQERSGKATPEATHKRITTLQQQIQDNRNFIAERRKERDAIKTKFDTDLERFKELRAQRTAPPPR